MEYPALLQLKKV